MKKSVYRKAAEIVHKKNIFSCTALYSYLSIDDLNVYIEVISSYKYYFSHTSHSCNYLTWWNKSPNSYDNKLTRTLALLLMDEIIKTEECKNEDF